MECRYREEKGIPPSTVLLKKDLVDFPFGRTRSGAYVAPPNIHCFYSALRFSLQLNRLAVPLVAQFFIS